MAPSCPCRAAPDKEHEMATRKRAKSDLKVQQGKQRDAFFARVRRAEATRLQRLARSRASSGS